GLHRPVLLDARERHRDRHADAGLRGEDHRAEGEAVRRDHAAPRRGDAGAAFPQVVRSLAAADYLPGGFAACPPRFARRAAPPPWTPFLVHSWRPTSHGGLAALPPRF